MPLKSYQLFRRTMVMLASVMIAFGYALPVAILAGQIVAVRIFRQEFETQCHGICPLKDCLIRKVKKNLRQPKFDVSALMELHGGARVH